MTTKIKKTPEEQFRSRLISETVFNHALDVKSRAIPTTSYTEDEDDDPPHQVVRKPRATYLDDNNNSSDEDIDTIAFVSSTMVAAAATTAADDAANGDDDDGSSSDETSDATARFKMWLGVQPGAHISVLEKKVREANPSLSAAKVHAAALKMLESDKKKKKKKKRKRGGGDDEDDEDEDDGGGGGADYDNDDGGGAGVTRPISDEKACQLLLHAYFSSQDAEARVIYMLYQRQHIERACNSDVAATERRLKAVEMSLSVCDRMLAQRRQTVPGVVGALLKKHVAWENGIAPLEDIRESVHASRPLITAAAAAAESDTSQLQLMPKVRGIDGTVTIGAPPSSVMHSAAEFVSAYTSDLTNTADQVKQRHLSEMSRSLTSAINLTAALIETAPDDAIFMTDAPARATVAHPIEAMQAILERALPGHAFDPELLARYRHEWMRTQNESSEDIDRAIVATHRRQEHEAITRDMATRGVSEADLAASLAHGVDPHQSHFMMAVIEFTRGEFEAANNEAAERTNAARRSEQAREGRRSDTAELHDMQYFTEAARRLETCSRAYLSKYMRAPLGVRYFERPCLNGAACICLSIGATFPALGSSVGGVTARNVTGNGTTSIGMSFDRSSQRPHAAHDEHAPPQPHEQANSVGRNSQGFICREFLLPSQETALLQTGTLPDEQSVCILCNRYATTAAYYMAMQQHGPGKPLLPRHLLQNHSVEIGQAGEYDKSVCLLTTFGNHRFTGIVKPFVGWSDSHYRYATTLEHQTVLRCLVETDTLDFRQASASTTRT